MTRNTLLLIDVGNTHTVMGLAPLEVDAELLHTWRLATSPERTGDELFLVIHQLLESRSLTLADIEGIAVSSGVPDVTAALREMCETHHDREPTVVGPGVKTGIPILIDNPREVGADRVANSVAAVDLHGGPAIVVDFGTATTFDVVSGTGEFLGGAILPGIEVSLDALFSRASALSSVELVSPRGVIGKGTTEAIQSGVIYGFGGMIDAMCRKFKEVVGDEATVVATGGLASTIAPYSEQIELEDPWLTLHGLRLIYAKNASPERE